MLGMWIVIACLAISLPLFTETSNKALRKSLTAVKLQRGLLMEAVRNMNEQLSKEAQK